MVQLVPAALHQKPVLAQLIELYEYDMSIFTGEDVGPDGRFGYKYLDFYWSETGRRPYITLAEGTLCGFVLVRLDVRSALHAEKTAHNIAEFFILRRFRGRGYGRLAAFQAFDLFPGDWEVFQIAGHEPALAFWRRVIGAYTSGRYREAELDNSEWRGTVQAFNNRSG